MEAFADQLIASQMMAETQNPFESSQSPRILPELIGQSIGITNLRAEVAHLLSRQGRGRRLPTLLLLGETGTGKGLLARAIHRASQRALRPFVDIDCAAIPETLLEAELFGVERGAFTDARETKPGLFQTARGGTLLLDEVGLMPSTLQGKLLKVVEERAVRRLGSTQSEVVDLWILAATNVDLVAAVRNGSFREDLYHRLAAVTLMLPPLRSREGDVVLLAQHFLDRACAEYGLPPKTLAPDALAALTAYHWPGNVRELANRLERVVLMSGEDSVISGKLLALPGIVPPVELPAASRDTVRLRSRVEEFEREHLVEALRAAHGNITMAAARLGLPRNTLRYRMDKLGIGAEGAGDPPARVGRALPRMGPGSVAPDRVSAPALSLRRDATRQVVLLRVDVGDEDLRRPAAQVPEFVATKVHSLGGRMEVREGPRLLATFGVYPCDEAASRAAHAAIAISKTISARIALHVCEVPVRRVNSAFVIDEAHHRQAEAVLAAILSSTEDAPLVCCQATARLLEGRFELEQMATAGTARPAFRLLGHKWPQRRPDNPPSTQFVGRRLRLELLEGLFRRAAGGHGQAVGIVAETGAGKSRLLNEFRQRLEQKQLAHHWARFVPYGRGLADLTVVEVLRQAWQIAHEDGGEVITRKVRAGLETLGMDADRWTPYLLVLFGVWAGTGHLTRLSREELKLGVFDALRHVAVEWSRRVPVIVELDDVELFGNTGREFLAYLVESLPTSRILMLSTYPPEYHPPWAGKSYFTQLTLPPLPPDESLALLDTLLPRGVGTEQLAETIAEKAGGNPLFLEELARSALKGDSSDDSPLPDAVRAVLQARMDSLEAGARRLLQVASVLGRRVPAKLLERVWEERGRLRECLAACKRLELLQDEVVKGEPAYGFKSALLWQFAYQSVPPVERQALRRAAGLPD